MTETPTTNPIPDGVMTLHRVAAFEIRETTLNHNGSLDIFFVDDVVAPVNKKSDWVGEHGEHVKVGGHYTIWNDGHCSAVLPGAVQVGYSRGVDGADDGGPRDGDVSSMADERVGATVYGKFFHSEHWNDADDNPAGGTTFGCGFAIGWQMGPLGRGDERQQPNGAFVENIIRAAADRIEYYQASKFECESNAAALSHLQHALGHLDSRTKEREERQVEGTHTA